MYSYVTSELRQLVDKYFNTSGKQSITGHSMGGHGALICALKNPGLYSSVSAFSPICNPMECPWGQKAFTGYLGSNKDTWKAYDSCQLLKTYSGPALNILVDQGAADQFLSDGQLLPDHLETACATASQKAIVRMQDGYDHSYFFISTFIGDHLHHHAKFLK
ncbi:ESD [Bugula neritina]|uniref:S-formylglutathione hydrolase n=1 Tax=Bugula neritina TaxID=10212 RepID=A0A7J7KDD6_BUGNE|nr:ESD [Bugula neritina]